MKTTIVLGLMASGSGVVHDYLSSRKDFESPFGPNEFKLCADPLGLHYLYINCYKNFSFFNPSHVMDEFLNYSDRLQQFNVYEKHNKPKKLYKKNFDIISKEFIKKITDTSYYANPEFSNFKINSFESFVLKLKKSRYNFFNVRLPVNEKKFIDESKKYIKKIILNNLERKKLKKNANVVLNQAINIFDPISSSQYFEKKKIVIVMRDPRDIFASMKHRKSKGTPHQNVHIFIKWFKRCFESNYFNKNLKHKDILIINFESFVNNFDRENKRLCKFLNINKKFQLKKNYSNLFNLEFSKKNLYKSKFNLTNDEFLLIKKKLKKFLLW